MVRVYIEKQGVPEVLMSLVFWPNFKFEISPKRLFLREIMAQYTEPFFHITDRPEEADFFAVPYEYFLAQDVYPQYLARVFALAKSAGKKVLLFDYTDYVDRQPQLPSHAVLFRVSAYRHRKQQNEIIMPYFVEDMGKHFSIAPKEKSETCVVGYCGQSQFQNIGRKWRASLKWLFLSLLLRVRRDREPRTHMLGVLWRAEALRVLRVGGVRTSFIERSFYSLHRGVNLSDPSEVRRAYVENLRECDLALCVRGGANASQRFYESLSASRIPLFLDTDCVLPLEEIIRYDEALLRVPSREIETLPTRVRGWWAKQTPQSFLVRQESARAIYEKCLRLDRYFEIVFDRERSPYKILFNDEWR